MIVFKTFLKILNKNKFIVILYTVILVTFGGLNMNTSDTSTDFIASKPDVLIINNDSENKITKNLINYITEHSNIKDIKNNEDAINDALFYRDVNYIIYIPKNYREEFLNGKNPTIEIKSTGDYQSSLAEMLLERYLKVANIYNSSIDNEDKLIEKINEIIDNEVDVEITSKVDAVTITKTSFYYNFLSYSMMAATIYIICMVLSTFHNESIRKRTIVSSMSYKKHNRILLLANGIFSLLLWIIYSVLGIILCGNIMFTSFGIIYFINSFIFTICCLTIAFLISNLCNNKNAIGGIVNVVALGSSFLCGAFVPAEWLPDFVLKFAHILPTFWYIDTNEKLKVIEHLNVDTLKPLLINMGVVLIFSLVFIMLSNLVSKKKQKIA